MKVNVLNGKEVSFPIKLSALSSETKLMWGVVCLFLCTET